MLTKQLINSRAKTISPFDLFYILGKGIYMQLMVNEGKMCLNEQRQSGVESSAKHMVYVFLDLLLPLG